MVAAAQACVDEAVSKTVNLPRGARSIDVYDIHARAWQLGCKGITVYVDGSRDVQPQARCSILALRTVDVAIPGDGRPQLGIDREPGTLDGIHSASQGRASALAVRCRTSLSVVARDGGSGRLSGRRTSRSPGCEG
jgi:hypothetical protein